MSNYYIYTYYSIQITVEYFILLEEMSDKISEKEKEKLKKMITTQTFGPVTIAFCIANKESKTGLFNNERFLLLHGGEKSIRYYSKIPEKFPFVTEESLGLGKEKVSIEGVQNWKCIPVKGKNSTLIMEWETGGNKNSWIFGMGTSVMMNHWISLVNDMKQGKLVVKEKMIVQSDIQKVQQIESSINPYAQHSHIPSNQPYSDVASQIRFLREKDKDKFNLSNQLSQKQLHEKEQQKRRAQQQYELKLRLLQKERLQQERKQQENRRYAEALRQEELKRQLEEEKRKLEQEKIQKERQEKEQGMKKKSKSSLYEEQRQVQIEKKIAAQESFNMSRMKEQGSAYQKVHESPINYSLAKPIAHGSQKQIPRSPSQSFENPKARFNTLSEYNYREMSKKPNPHISVVPRVRKWNQQWCSSNDPLTIYDEFIEQCKDVGCSIIEQLVYLKSQRQFIPVQSKNPYTVYEHDGIQFTMHCFSDEKSQYDTENAQAPLLFPQSSYFQLKRQFYNYNYIMSHTGNKGPFKVPLCFYFEYKGILMICKAAITNKFEKVSPHQYEKQLEALEEVLKVKLVFDEVELFMEGEGRYVLIGSVENLLPRVPGHSAKQIPAYFRGELLVQSEIAIKDQRSVLNLDNIITKQIIPDFINRLEGLQFWIINPVDLMRQLHKSGINSSYLSQLYSQSTSIYMRKLFLTQMISQVFCGILRSELNHVISTFPVSDFQAQESSIINSILLDCVHMMMDQLFSYGNKSEVIWRVIVKEVKKINDVVVSKEDILPGFLLASIIHEHGIECDFKINDFSRDIQFFVRENTIPRAIFIGFKVRQRMFDLVSLSPTLEAIEEIVSAEPNSENFQHLVQMLKLKQEVIPSFCEFFKPQILTYLCNFVAIGQDDEFSHIGMYDCLEQEPHTFYSTKISLLAIKWAVKRQNEELATKIFQMKFQENAFWVCQFNPAITQFYDFFSMYYISAGNYDQAIKLAKSSLINVIKLLGPNGLPTADKHYQLGNIFFKVNKKQQALKEYLKTKNILQFHHQTSIPQYGVILLKLSLLYLNFGRVAESVSCGLEALKIIDTNGGNEEDEIQIFQILSRGYQITHKKTDLISLSSLCAQKFNQTETLKIFQRMLKIVLYPRLVTMNSQNSKSLLHILQRLSEQESGITNMEAFSFLHRRSHYEVIGKRIVAFLDGAEQIGEQVNRRDLLRRHRPLADGKEESADMLVILQAVASIIGYGFLIGCLRDPYYG